MRLFSTTPSQRQLDFGLLALRLALAAVFIVHGGAKLFQMGPSGSGEMLVKMGVPRGAIVGALLAFVEPLAGVGVLLGLFTRLAGLAIAIDMASAVATFHIHHGFYVPMGIEFVMMNCAGGLALAFLGAGSFSVDQIIDQRRSPT